MKVLDRSAANETRAIVFATAIAIIKALTAHAKSTNNADTEISLAACTAT